MAISLAVVVSCCRVLFQQVAIGRKPKPVRRKKPRHVPHPLRPAGWRRARKLALELSLRRANQSWSGAVMLMLTRRQLFSSSVNLPLLVPLSGRLLQEMDEGCLLRGIAFQLYFLAR